MTRRTNPPTPPSGLMVHVIDAFDTLMRRAMAIEKALIHLVDDPDWASDEPIAGDLNEMLLEHLEAPDLRCAVYARVSTFPRLGGYTTMGRT